MNKSEERRPEPFNSIREAAMDLIFESESKITPNRLKKVLLQQFVVNEKTVHTVIRSLVEDNQIVYTHQFGCSFLEKSMNKPIRISNRIVLKPPEITYVPFPKEIVIDLRHGASFGTGEHPTTRLALRGIEHALSYNGSLPMIKPSYALDIGTGSGILAIAVVSLGITRSIGIDIDPCAIAEAKKNVQLNRLEHRVEVENKRVEEIDRQFSLITANLRYPTLRYLCPCLTGLLESDGYVVVSGVKSDEISSLMDIFFGNGFRCVWQEIEKSWAGLVFYVA